MQHWGGGIRTAACVVCGGLAWRRENWPWYSVPPGVDGSLCALADAFVRLRCEKSYPNLPQSRLGTSVQKGPVQESLSVGIKTKCWGLEGYPSSDES